ncbi:MAG: hypothetical protein LBV04_02475 [Deferribacteraceae bacterium]|jgi:hypothetical protein|nr:hypothetical protein [Deferribacteraceae bacterium]
MDINLLKTYNMSLTDIYKQMIDADAYDSQYVPSKGLTLPKKIFFTILTVLVSFGLIGALLVLAFDPFNKPPTPIVQLEVPVDVPPIVPAPANYVQIQVLDFGDLEIAQQPEVETLPAQPASETPANTRPTPPARPRPTPPAQPRGTSPYYAVTLSGATAGDYDIITSLAQASSAQAEVVDVRTTMEMRWIVYTPQAGTGLAIANLWTNGLDTLPAGLRADMEVAPIRNFASREEAVAYANNYGAVTIIFAETVEHPFYELRVCCMELEAAKLFAQRTGITDKVFQLRRE